VVDISCSCGTTYSLFLFSQLFVAFCLFLLCWYYPKTLLISGYSVWKINYLRILFWNMKSIPNWPWEHWLCGKTRGVESGGRGSNRGWGKKSFFCADNSILVIYLTAMKNSHSVYNFHFTKYWKNSTPLMRDWFTFRHIFISETLAPRDHFNAPHSFKRHDVSPASWDHSGLSVSLRSLSLTVAS
jgi:hypothetical protein